MTSEDEVWDDNSPSMQLYYVLSQLDLQQVQTLVNQGINVNMLLVDGQSMLERVADLGHIQVARWLIDQGADVNFQDDCGYTALLLATESGHLAMVNLLIDSGADLTVCGGSDAGTALHKAARDGNIEMLCLLLDRGADPNAKDMDGDTIPHLQRSLFLKQRPEITLQILELLMKAGATS